MGASDKKKEKVKEKLIALKVIISDCNKESNKFDEDDIASLARKFKNFLEDKKKKFDWKNVKGKNKNFSEGANPNWFECTILGIN